MDRREMFGGLVGALGASSFACAHDDKGGVGAANPMTGPHAHFCGIHMAKNNPKFQIITQHYCAAHTQDGEDAMFQCVLFDTTGKNAKLLGVEYLISDAAYRKLPADELKYWHAHTYEVLGGGLIAPAMTAEDEMKFMKAVLPMWGKAWHTWPDPSTKVPMGDPILIWSLMADGQVDEKLVAQRDRDFKVSNAKLREVRAKEFGLGMPKVSVPKDMNTVGRQWTDTGDDKPTKK